MLTRLQSRLGLLQPGRARSPRPAADAARHDRLEPRPARRAGAAAVRAAGGVRRGLRRWRPPKRSAAATTWASTCSTAWRRWSTRAWCGRKQHDGEPRVRSCSRRSASTRWSSSPRARRRGGGAQPPRAPVPRPRRGGRAAPAARRAARLARPGWSASTTTCARRSISAPAPGAPRGAAPGRRALALLAVPRPPARGGAAGQARARRSGVARPSGCPRGGPRDRGRPRLLAR